MSDRDQQDEQASGHWNWDVDDAAPSVKLRDALDKARAEGERAATERIVRWLRDVFPDHMTSANQDAAIYRAADAIERGEHE